MDQKLMKADRDLMQQFTELVREFYKRVHAMSDAEIATLTVVASRFGRTNCSWQEYDAAQIVLDAIRLQRQVRTAKAAAV